MARSDRPATPEKYEELLQTLSEVIEHLVELKAENPAEYERQRESGELDFLRELAKRHPEIIGDLTARLEFEELQEDERFRDALEQMRRGERGQWPPGWEEELNRADYVSAEPGEDWDPED